MFLCAFIYFVLYFYILKQMADHELDFVTIRKLSSTRHFKSEWMHKVSPHGEREGDHQKKYLLNLLQQYQHHGQSPPTLFADCTTAAMKNVIHDILMNILKNNVI